MNASIYLCACVCVYTHRSINLCISANVPSSMVLMRFLLNALNQKKTYITAPPQRYTPIQQGLQCRRMKSYIYLYVNQLCLYLWVIIESEDHT